MYTGKEEDGRGCFELKLIGGEREFRIVAASYWLSCQGFYRQAVAGQGNIFLLSVGVCKISFLLRYAARSGSQTREREKDQTEKKLYILWTKGVSKEC